LHYRYGSIGHFLADPNNYTLPSAESNSKYNAEHISSLEMFQIGATEVELGNGMREFKVHLTNAGKMAAATSLSDVSGGTNIHPTNASRSAYNSLRVPELRELAKSRNVQFTRKRKAELVDALLQADADAIATGAGTGAGTDAGAGAGAVAVAGTNLSNNTYAMEAEGIDLSHYHAQNPHLPTMPTYTGGTGYSGSDSSENDGVDRDRDREAYAAQIDDWAVDLLVASVAVNGGNPVSNRDVGRILAAFHLPVGAVHNVVSASGGSGTERSVTALHLIKSRHGGVLQFLERVVEKGSGAVGAKLVINWRYPKGVFSRKIKGGYSVALV
jgi:hypothetical protein